MFRGVSDLHTVMLGNFSEGVYLVSLVVDKPTVVDELEGGRLAQTAQTSGKLGLLGGHANELLVLGR